MGAKNQTAARGESAVANMVFDILSNTERRLLLRSLARNGPVMNVEDLAEQLATDESGNGPTDQAVGLKQTTLVHTHLPKLAAAGLLRWQAGDDEVRVTSLLDELTVTTPVTGNILDMTVSHSPPRRP